MGDEVRGGEDKANAGQDGQGNPKLAEGGLNDVIEAVSVDSLVGLNCCANLAGSVGAELVAVAVVMVLDATEVELRQGGSVTIVGDVLLVALRSVVGVTLLGAGDGVVECLIGATLSVGGGATCQKGGCGYYCDCRVAKLAREISSQRCPVNGFDPASSEAQSEISSCCCASSNNCASKTLLKFQGSVHFQCQLSDTSLWWCWMFHIVLKVRPFFPLGVTS